MKQENVTSNFLTETEKFTPRRLFTNVEEVTPQRLFSKIDVPQTSKKLFTPIATPATSMESSTKATMSSITEEKALRKIFTRLPEVSENEKRLATISPTKKILSPEIKQLLERDSRNCEVCNDYGNFEISLLQKIIEIGGNNNVESTKVFYKFRILVDGLDEYLVTLPGHQLYNLSWISNATGGAAYFFNDASDRPKVVKMIQNMISARRFEIQRVFTHNGWKQINGNWKYLIDDGIIGENFQGFVGDSEHPFLYRKDDVGLASTFVKALNMTQICYDETCSLPLLLFTHSASLCKLFELAHVPIKGCLAVIGATNSRKTSAALCLTKTFNRENIFEPEISFDSTVCGIEEESSKHGDSILLIDDFHPAISKKGQNKLLDTLEFILRRYGDRVEKKRMMAFSDKKTSGKFEVTGLCVITGEDIGGVQSSLTRVLTLEVNRDTVNNDVLTFYQNAPLILNTHLYDFISYVTVHFDNVVEYIKNRVWEIRKNKKYAIPRFSEYFAQLMTTAEIICHYASARGFWNVSECNRWLAHCENILNSVIQKNLIDIEREDFALIVTQALKYTIEKNGVISLTNIHNNQLAYNEIATDEDNIYIHAEFLLESTKKYWAQLGKELPFSSKKQLTFFLEQKGLIRVHKEKDSIRRTLPIPGGKQRVLHIQKGKVTELLAKIEV